jgi:peptidoglycan/LPS O-acetylase OafA/YrhL
MHDQSKQNLYWLDLLRGLAALTVMIGHLRSVLFCDFESIPNPTALDKAFYFVTGFGHQAVIVFFVLSGFFIIRSIDQAISANKWSWRDYLINRLSRLWTVLIPGLFLGLFWDELGLMFYSGYEVYSGSIAHLSYFDPNGKLDFLTFLGNLTFVQTVCVDTFGTNGALWSLCNEFWYYITFPLIYVGFRMRGSLWGVLPGVAILFLLDYFAIDRATHPALYFVVWLFGGVSVWMVSRFRAPHFAGLYSAALGLMLVVFLCGIRAKTSALLFNDITLGVVTMLLVVFLSMTEMKLRLLKSVSAFLSSISYTLYLVHLPIAVFASAFFFEKRITFTSASFIYFLAMCVFILSYAWAIYYLFERNTYRVKKYFSRTLG